MFRIYFINFGWYSQNESEDLAGAKKVAKAAGFESRVDSPDGTPIALYSPLYGWTVYDRDLWKPAA